MESIPTNNVLTMGKEQINKGWKKNETFKRETLRNRKTKHSKGWRAHKFTDERFI